MPNAINELDSESRASNAFILFAEPVGMTRASMFTITRRSELSSRQVNSGTHSLRLGRAAAPQESIIAVLA